MRTGVGAVRTIAACGLFALAITGCKGPGAPVSQARSLLGDAPDAAVPEPIPTLAAPPANQQASWQTLWGTWPAARYDFAMSFDSDKDLIIVQGGRVGPSGPYFGDTWVWDSVRGSWVETTPAAGNNFERAGHSMVYDPIRKKTFLFGGWQPGASFYIPDMWEYDSTTATWTERTANGAQPSSRYGYGMVWDPDRQKVLLFGGYDETGTRKNDLWAWDGTATTWTPVTQTGMIPAPRYGHRMAYDVARKKVVLHSGNTGTGTGNFVSDTYELDTTGAWTKVNTTGSTIYGANGWDNITYDAGRSRVLCYSGGWQYMYDLDSVTPNWTLLTTTKADVNAAPAQNFAGMVYDISRSMSVVFAGQGIRTLWDFNGADFSWTNRSNPVNGPLERANPTLAYDSMRSKMMLFGGKTSDGVFHQDMFEWSHSDATFINRTTAATKPPGRSQSAMAYDSKRDRILMYGGGGVGFYDDLWAWHPADKTWEQLPNTAIPRPPTMINHLMAYDAAVDKVLVAAATQYFPVWQWDPVTGLWTDRSTPSNLMPSDLISHVNWTMAFDSDRRKLVVFGGTLFGKDTADLWEWDVATAVWSKRDVPASGSVPSVRRLAALAYDSGRRVMVMYGGAGGVAGASGGDPLGDSWEWDGKLNVWTETTPVGIKPLRRYQPLTMYDPTRLVTYVFGGVVPDDSTYGPSEIWQYFPNSTPRPNGAACSTATASTCASGQCVDGVCCASASCPGTCRACNVPGNEGACANVPPGSPDDTCASDQACDAAQQC